MEPNAVWHVARKYAALPGIEKSVSTHSFRHSCTTHMLRNGAPIRQLQEMLGHASLETAQISTPVTINDLRAMHSKFHPRERADEDAATQIDTRGPPSYNGSFRSLGIAPCMPVLL